MNDDEITKSSRNGPKKEGPTDREKSRVEPVPKHPEFTEWLIGLFASEGDFPEKIKVAAKSGKQYMQYGQTIKEVVYPPKAQKPTREQLVAMSNEILGLIQADCDVQRRSIVYGIHAMHYSRDSESYAHKLIRCNPTPVHARSGEPREEDDEYETPGIKRERQIYDHAERMFDLYSRSYEGMMDRFDRILERQDVRIDKQDARIEKLGDMLEKAMSLEEERRLNRMWTELKIKSSEKGLDMAFSLAPPLLNQLTGKKVVPTEETAETITLKNFFKTKEDGGSLTTDQSAAIFGRFHGEEKNFEMITPGVLTVEQSKLLYDVAHCNVPADKLDDLLPGGPHAITQEQVKDLISKCGLDMSQIAPIQIIMDARLKRKQAMQGGK